MAERTLSTRPHMRWCQERALAYADAGNLTEALASFLSDIQKDDSTKDDESFMFFLPLAIAAVRDGDQRRLIKWIEDWN